jgi:hypothetical protein
MNQETFVENAQGRHADDFYRTPAPVTMALCDEFKLRGIEPKTILDVGCGDGAIGKVLRGAWPTADIQAIEINAERRLAADLCSIECAYDITWHADWFDEKQPWRDYDLAGQDRDPLPDLIVSNPPFKVALPAIKLALQRVRSGGHVAFLLISQFDQETVFDDERGRFLDSLRGADGSEGYGKLRWKGRVDFRGNGRTDRVSHEWLVIGPGFEGSFIRVPRSPMVEPEQLTMGIA